MTLSVNRKTLLDALSSASHCLETKGTIPALSFVMLEMNDERLKITGTDLDVTYQTVVEADGDNGAFGVPAQQLTRLVGLFEDDRVSLMYDEKTERVTIKCSKSKYTLPALRQDSFPNIETVTGKAFIISGLMLKSMLARTVFCTSTEESRWIMAGVLLETKNARLHAVGTDGYRAALVKYGIAFPDEVSGVVPAKAVKAVIASLNDDDPVSVFIGDEAATFTQGDTVLRTRLVIGQFPKYEMIIPSERRHSVVISSTAQNVFKRSAITAGRITISNAPEMFFTVSKDSIEISSRDNEAEGVEIIEAKCDTLNGDSVPLKFASKYLSDLFSLEPELNLSFDDNNNSFLITPNGLRDYEYKYVVMPCRI